MKLRHTVLTSLAGLAIAGVSFAWTQESAKSEESLPGEKLMFVHKLSELAGSEVRNSKGEEIGAIEELIVHPSSGGIEYAAVSIGGFLGLGERLYPIPWSLLNPRHAEDSTDVFFLLDVPRATLESAPAFVSDAWPRVDSDWERTICRHYGTLLPEPAQDGIRMLVRCEALSDARVMGEEERELGSIEEIAVDPTEGCLNYVVLQSEQPETGETERYVLPWGTLHVEPAVESAVRVEAPDVSAKALRVAPVFELDSWLLMSNPVWLRTVYTFWELDPYWSTAIEAGFAKPMEDSEDGASSEESKSKQEQGS